MLYVVTIRGFVSVERELDVFNFNDEVQEMIVDTVSLLVQIEQLKAENEKLKAILKEAIELLRESQRKSADYTWAKKRDRLLLSI